MGVTGKLGTTELVSELDVKSYFYSINSSFLIRYLVLVFDYSRISSEVPRFTFEYGSSAFNASRYSMFYFPTIKHT